MKFQKHIYLSILIILSLIFIFDVIHGGKVPTDSFNPSVPTMSFKSGDKITQKLRFNHRKVNKFIFREATYGTNIKHIDFSISLLDDNNKIIKKQNYSFDHFGDGAFIEFNVGKKDLIGDYYIIINIDNISDGDTFTLYTDNDLNYYTQYTINNKTFDGNIYVNVAGYKTGYFSSFILLIIIAVLCVITFIKNDFFNDNFKNFLTGKISLIIYFFSSITFSISLAVSYYLNKKIIDPSLINVYDGDFINKTSLCNNVCKMFLALLLINTLFLIIYFCVNVKSNKITLHRLFLLIGIPIGFMYMLYINPINVPDSQFHYLSAYQPVIMNFNKNKDVYCPEIINNEKYNAPQSYGQYYNLIKRTNSYTNVKYFEQRGRYSFIDYVPTTVGLLIGKLLHLSPYIGLYLAKCISYLLFLAIGYFIIKKIPVGKLLFFVFMLSPTFVAQAISISIDSIINMSSLLFVAYILYIKYSEEKELSYSNIALLSLFLLLCSIQKLNYAILGFVVFIVFNKIKNTNYKKWIVSGICCVILGAIICFPYLKGVASGTPTVGLISASGYFKSDIFKAIYILINTFIHLFPSHLMQSFVSDIGWLDTTVSIPIISSVMYFMALCISLMDKDEHDLELNAWEKLLLIIIYAIGLAFIGYALYTGWTYVGLMIVDGIQGRYFVPLNMVLLLLIYSSIKKVKIENYLFISLLLLSSHVILLIEVIKRFI